jgi:squalene-hopene/tetraprenyl-beta-curcumene cyclase
MENEKKITGSPQVSRREFGAAALTSAALVAGGGATALAETQGNGTTADAYSRCVERAIHYLESRQLEDGSFNRQAGIGVTALVATAFLRHGRSVRDPVVAKSLKYIEAGAHADGGIYSPDGMVANYETCLSIMCLKQANIDHHYDGLLKHAEKYIRTHQWDESMDKTSNDLAYGGAGYGKHKRPDLSNTSFLIDALKACGGGPDDPDACGPDDPAIQKALVFVSRCQNLESKYNTTPFASKVKDGGFYYTCAAGGRSVAGMNADGGLRSYGSMTYSGLKSMLHAGLGPDDPRIKAAVAWIQRNYDLKANPGLGNAGLYYYYHVFAKALDILGGESFTDASGVAHDWRRELAEQMFRLQKENGSWVNSDDHWMEGDPNLVTAYALLALDHCRPRKS